MVKSIVGDNEITEFIEGSSVLVVIVSYKTGELIINTLNSLLLELSKQPLMRIIIVDNTCGSDFEQIVSANLDELLIERLRVIISKHNGGFAYGNNLAIRPSLLAQQPPEFIWLLNPDTEVYPGAGAALVNFLNKNDTVGIAGSCLINHDGNEWGIAFRFPSMISEFERAVRFGPFSKLVKNYNVSMKMGDKDCQVGWLPGASMMIRRKVFNSAGLFDEKYFLYYEETDFSLKAKSKGWSSWYVPTSKVMHIAGQSTGATGVLSESKRLPDYMFNSRSYYFIKNHGIIYAITADLIRIFGLILSKILFLLRGLENSHRPHLLRDSVKNFIPFKFAMTIFRSKSITK